MPKSPEAPTTPKQVAADFYQDSTHIKGQYPQVAIMETDGVSVDVVKWPILSDYARTATHYFEDLANQTITDRRDPSTIDLDKVDEFEGRLISDARKSIEKSGLAQDLITFD